MKPTDAQRRVLAVLLERGPMQRGSVEFHAKVWAVNIYRVLRRLLDAGWISAPDCPDPHYSITEAGREALRCEPGDRARRSP